MQLLPILLVLPLLIADGAAWPGLVAEPTARTPFEAIGLPVIVVAIAWLTVRLMIGRMARTRRARWMLRADRLLALSRLVLVIGGGAAVLAGGWLAWVRERVGDLVLVDELLAMAPTVAGLAGLWAVQHAIEVRLRDAIRLRRLDEGRPIWPTPGRGNFVLGQVRLQLGLLGVPIIAVLGIAEAIRWGLGFAGDSVPAWTADVASVGAAAIVFTLAPLAMRVVLPISPMPTGTVRDDLVVMCDSLGVRVGDVMLWRTHGTLVNAAVVGILPRIRYVLLTDAMVEQVARPAVRAVIAHELAHVRHRHVPWLIVTLAGLLTMAGSLAAAPAVALVERGYAPDGAEVGWAAGVVGVAALVGVGFAFGWVSRRYERQADTYAVQAMSREPAWAKAEPAIEVRGTGDDEAGNSAPAVSAVRPPAVLTVGDLGGGPGASSPPSDGRDARVRSEAVFAMTSALGATARLNGVDPTRRSWRHGSIAWRQRYLAELIGRPVDRLAIDRTIGRLKVAAAIGLIVGVGATAAVDAWETAVYDTRERDQSPMFDGPLAPLLEMPLAPRRRGGAERPGT